MDKYICYNTETDLSLQNEALCIISFSKFDQHSAPLFKKCEMLNFTYVIYIHNAILCTDLVIKCSLQTSSQYLVDTPTM